MQPSLSNDLVYILPWLGAGLVHFLKGQRLPTWLNALIAGVFLVAISVACAWLGNDFIPGNVRASILVVVGYVVVLMNGALHIIMQYFEELTSPIEPKPANPNPVSALGTRAFVPDGSSSETVIPKRASRTEE